MFVATNEREWIWWNSWLRPRRFRGRAGEWVGGYVRARGQKGGGNAYRLLGRRGVCGGVVGGRHRRCNPRGFGPSGAAGRLEGARGINAEGEDAEHGAEHHLAIWKRW